MPPSPNSLDEWVDRALTDNLNVRIARYNADIATLEIERQRAGRLPTLDLVASANAQAGSGSVNTNAFNDQRQAAIGLALTVPLYQGGLIDSKVR
jgi:outer membrane protein